MTEMPRDLSVRITRIETGADGGTFCYESFDPDVDEAYVVARAPLTLAQCVEAAREFFGEDTRP